MQKKSAVLHFIDEERSKGKSDKDICHQLLDRGWHMDIIQNAMHKKHNDSTPAKHTVPVTKKFSATHLQNPYIWVGIFGLLVLLALFI